MEVMESNTLQEGMMMDQEQESWKSKVNLKVQGFTFGQEEFQNQLKQLQITPSSMCFTNHPKGKVFLDFETEEEAQKALKKIELHPCISMVHLVSKDTTKTKSKKEFHCHVIFVDPLDRLSLPLSQKRLVCLTRWNTKVQQNNVGYWHLFRTTSRANRKTQASQQFQTLPILKLGAIQQTLISQHNNKNFESLVISEYWNLIGGDFQLFSETCMNLMQNHYLDGNQFQWMTLQEAKQQVHVSEKQILDILDQEILSFPS